LLPILPPASPITPQANGVVVSSSDTPLLTQDVVSEYKYKQCDPNEAPRDIREDLVTCAPKQSNGHDMLYGHVVCPGCQAYTAIQVLVYQKLDESPIIQQGCRWMDDPYDLRVCGREGTRDDVMTEITRTGRMGCDMSYTCEWCENPFHVSTRVLPPTNKYVPDPTAKLSPKYIPRSATYTDSVRKRRTDKQDTLYVRQDGLGYDPSIISLNEKQIQVLEKREAGNFMLDSETTLVRVTEKSYSDLLGTTVDVADRDSRNRQYLWVMNVERLIKSGAVVHRTTKLAHRSLVKSLYKYKKSVNVKK